MVAMRGIPAAGRPADVAADDALTVTRHAVERRDVIVVPANPGAQMQEGSIRASLIPTDDLPEPVSARAQSSSAAVESRSILEPCVRKCCGHNHDCYQQFIDSISGLEARVATLQTHVVAHQEQI